MSRKTGGMHGIGLSSIRNAAEKYGGTIAAATDAFHNFTLTVMLPLPDGQGEP